LDTDAKKEAASQRHPLKKYGNPSEIASLAMFLISYDSSWITGQVIHADGGMSIIR
jgi:NAD(P)-dependent dehydrogenase (short-subunit alcohol dehydrogenase family)